MVAKVDHLIKTKSLKSDGRLLKWLDSLMQRNWVSRVHILEDRNLSSKYKVNDSVEVEEIKLNSRRIFNKRKGYFFKIPEYSYRTLKFITGSHSDIWIFHDVQHYLVLFLICLFNIHRKKRKIVVWDLHELPHSYLAGNMITRRIVKYILQRIDLVIYTNKTREKWILEHFGNNAMNGIVLNNFPDRKYIKMPKCQISRSLQDWLQGSPYILWMGIASKNRNFVPVINAVSKYRNNVRLVVMGTIEEEMKKEIQEKKMESFVYSNFVSQSEIPKYVDNALFSIVLYKHSSPNNFYCEPNRLYQLLVRGVPVICGNNPPMKEVVENFGGGIILPDDGSNSKSLAEAIDLMMEKEQLTIFKENLKRFDFAEIMSWEAQFESVAASFEKLISKKQ